LLRSRSRLLIRWRPRHILWKFCKELRWIGARLEILSRVGLKLGRIVDEAPPNSKRWAQAARELRAVSSECLRLPRLTGDEALIAEAERTAAILP
jgi:hypothetical protein